MKALVTITAALLAVTTLATARPARASHNDGFFSAMMGAMVAFPTIGVPGIITAIHNGAYRNELTDGWRNAGYVLGTMNLIAGVVLPVMGMSGGGGYDGARVGLNLAWSIPPLIVGGINLGFAITGKRPNEAPKRIQFVPISGLGARNQAFGGVGVQLVGF